MLPLSYTATSGVIQKKKGTIILIKKSLQEAPPTPATYDEADESRRIQGPFPGFPQVPHESQEGGLHPLKKAPQNHPQAPAGRNGSKIPSPDAILKAAAGEGSGSPLAADKPSHRQKLPATAGTVDPKPASGGVFVGGESATEVAWQRHTENDEGEGVGGVAQQWGDPGLEGSEGQGRSDDECTFQDENVAKLNMQPSQERNKTPTVHPTKMDHTARLVPSLLTFLTFYLLWLHIPSCQQLLGESLMAVLLGRGKQGWWCAVRCLA